MSEKVNEKIEEVCVKVCANKACNYAQFQKGTSNCWKCGGDSYIFQHIAFLGDRIIPSVSIVSENPPARPGASSSGFMQLI